MEKGAFEDSIKKALDGAEAEPQSHVWVNIELQLEREKAALLQRRMRRYQMLAAASLVFAVSVSLGLYFSGSQIPADPPANIAQAPERSDAGLGEQPAVSSQRVAPEEQSAGARSAAAPVAESADRSSPASPGRQAVRRSLTPPTDEISVAWVDATHRPRGSVTPGVRKPSSRLVADPDVKLPETKEVQEDPVQAMLARLAAREAALREEKENNKESVEWDNLWASVGASAGSFTSTNAGISATQNSFAARNSSIAAREVKASGTSYSAGVNLGTRIANRWVIQGGVSLINQTSAFEASNAVRGGTEGLQFRPASMASLRDAAGNQHSYLDNGLVATAPYDVTNGVRYVTVPLQAGYLIVNEVIGVQLNAGVATDIFLENTISAEGLNIETETIRAGQDSPFRTINFSGLVGTEISYKLGNRYRIALNPGLRYPFSSVYKSELGVRSSPLTFDLGLRFRYIFD